jgi:anti-sigma B factor antagonist
MIDIKTHVENGIHRILVKGDVDASSSIQLDDALKTALNDEGPILVDLRGLNYISSAGLGVFVSYLEDIRNRPSKFVIFGLNPAVTEIFGLLGLPELLPVVPTEKDALEALK